jgi:hypothetical protein
LKRPNRLRVVDGEITTASTAEYTADLLAGIEADLERRHVSDPEVWDGYPRSADEDDADDYYGGLFLNLVRCTRVEPSRVMAKAIEIAFELGRASIVGTADQDETERILAGMEKLDRARKRGGDKTGGYTQRDAEGGHKALKKMWAERREHVISDHELSREACADKRITKLSEERVRALFGQWKRDEERDTWATGCWIAVMTPESPTERTFPPKRPSKNGWERRTHDDYCVVLFEEDRKWRCLVRLSDEDGTRTVRSRRSAESLDEAKAESYAVVEVLREEQTQAKKRLAKRRAKRTGKIASRAACLPISTSRHKSRR